MDLLRNIYSWFNSLYGNYLYQYLKGNDNNGNFVGPNHFNTIGLIMIIASLLLVLIYYYVINHPRFNRWWHWGLMMIVNSVISLFVGFGYVYTKLNDGLIPAYFVYDKTTTDPSTGNISAAQDAIQVITNETAWQLGIANAIIAIAFFIILSFILKWWSTNAKRSPIL